MVEKRDKKDSTKPKRYLITAAQGSYHQVYNKSTKEYDLVADGPIAELHYNLMEGFKNYCDIHNAELIVLEMPGKNIAERFFHESVDQDSLFFGNKALNSNIKICDMVVPPQNVDPSTGRLRFAQKDTTLIYAHPKQRLRAVPAGNSKLPRLLITTGAVTTPNYNRNNHRGDVAFRDHVYGGVAVEIIDDVCYNVRFLKSQRDGQFVDMGFKYNGKNSPTHSKVEAIVLGDLHVGDEDPETMNANFEMIDYFKPKRVVLHDLFDGRSINPHEKDKNIRRIREYEAGKLSLENELRNCRDVLCDIAKATGKKNNVYVVSSNHPYFLDRYLDNGDFVKDPWNGKISLKIAEKMSEGEDPLKAGLNLFGKLPSNVNFLNLRDDLQVWGYQLASHGHKGISGARSSNATSREISWGKSITGHSHTPEIFRNTYIVGTSSKLDLDYTEGSASSWMAANAVLYEGGIVQLLPIIRGKWKAKE